MIISSILYLLKYLRAELAITLTHLETQLKQKRYQFEQVNIESKE